MHENLTPTIGQLSEKCHPCKPEIIFEKSSEKRIFCQNHWLGQAKFSQILNFWKKIDLGLIIFSTWFYSPDWAFGATNLAKVQASQFQMDKNSFDENVETVVTWDLNVIYSS